MTKTSVEVSGEFSSKHLFFSGGHKFSDVFGLICRFPFWGQFRQDIINTSDNKMILLQNMEIGQDVLNALPPQQRLRLVKQLRQEQVRS